MNADIDASPSAVLDVVQPAAEPAAQRRLVEPTIQPPTEGTPVARPAPTASRTVAAVRPGNGTVATHSTVSTADYERMMTQLQALIADMHALQEQLKVRGLLESDWQVPSVYQLAEADQQPETVAS
ncbi:MAG: hypothetical protein HC893_00285 [Chloroflexaceae bacterium]|nr:hypothetical protein [Chloroflexaceae bacterium]